jgi:hypothetical protein
MELDRGKRNPGHFRAKSARAITPSKIALAPNFARLRGPSQRPPAKVQYFVSQAPGSAADQLYQALKPSI